MILKISPEILVIVTEGGEAALSFMFFVVLYFLLFVCWKFKIKVYVIWANGTPPSTHITPWYFTLLS